MKSILRKLTVAWPLVIFLLLPALTRAETVVQAWVQRYNGPGSGEDQANAVAVDSSNNVIVTGYSTNGASGYDYATIKYSGDGVPLWTNRYNGPGNSHDQAYAVAVDRSNDVIVTGYSRGSGSAEDYATIKYSSAGVPLWTNRYNGSGNQYDQANAVAVDGSNNVIVTGVSIRSGMGFGDYATIKYSSAGVPLWTNRSGPGDNSDTAVAVAVDGNNDVIVTGNAFDAASHANYKTIKYSSAGVPLWTNRYNGPGDNSDTAVAVAVDGSNNVIVTGSSLSGIDLSIGESVTIKYSSDGEPLWTNRYSGLANYSSACAVAVDGSNNVIVTGTSPSTHVSPFNNMYTTIKYSSDGEPLWINRYSGPGNYSSAKDVAVDGNNNVIVTGYSDGDYATIKYSSAGEQLWTKRYNGPGNSGDRATAMAVDGGGNVIVTGYSRGSGSGYDFATIKYVSLAPPPVLTGLQLTDGTFQIRVDDVLQPGTLVIEASTNLAGWSPVFTNTTPTNVLFYTDPDAGNSPTRFYRAFQFP